MAAEVPSEHRSYWARVTSEYANAIPAYWRDAYSLKDFLALMRVRLAQSKIGWLVCPSRISASLRIRSFGPTPVRIRSHTTDVSVLGEIVVSKGYDALVRHPRGRPKLIVDLGANIGLVDRWFLNRYPGAEIIAVEPEPTNLETLKANVAGLPVKVVPAAVGATERTVRLHTVTGEHGFTMVGEPQPGSTCVEVPVVTMKSILGDAQVVDLLKVDIEGAEEELFADCRDWIGKVGMLLVECHGHYKVASLLDDLKRAGADFTVLECELKPEWDFEVALLERNPAGVSVQPSKLSDAVA
jgi:FkbM family methyltransferase